ncbi:hypothetical protein GUJ93_ZPchr0004g39838 [Zizania palustris]|uniref:Late embryogenesis abundant protein LEA-2 subgroup domain-containing protein n=1 Tax=Zizania palustris TaxID=103762 RepID=A0A8J5SPI0_ZIZPA|nr:hypothetical protein GUJ93_ZPchr0004g39838 [Zizania palustris]
MHGARLLQLQGIRVASVGSDQTPQIVVVVARDAATDGAPRTPPSHHPKNPQLYRSAHSGGRALLVFHSSPRHAPNGTRTRQPGKKTRMHHTKTDSEATSSMAASSPPRVAYYVQSPSHDDGENKTAVSSFHSSPAASPPRSLGHHSRESSSSRFSGAKSGSSRSGVGGGVGGVEAGRGGGNRRSPWMKEATIEEEGLLNEDDDPDGAGAGGGLPKRWRYALGFVGAFFALFFFFALILWGASHNQKPVVSISSITFHNFVIQAGTDASLVPTELSTLNATVRLTFRNTGSFFGVHVTAQPVTLYYYQLLMASGNVSSRTLAPISSVLIHYYFLPLHP